ncbi:MAG TPA: amidohydrolase family protein [Arenimonas sp.]|nr:amidohydrolase family protein [Arenimonas sp.]
MTPASASRIRLAVLAGLLSAALPSAAEQTLVRAGKLIDVDKGVVLSDQAILIEDGRIMSVQPYRAGLSDKARRLDWSAFTVAPGFMDMHTHLAGDIQNFSVEAYLKAKPEDDVLAGVANARKTLQAGFTTVRDVGSYNGFVDVSLRDAIAKGWLPGPRLFTAGAYVTVPGGGGEVSGLVDAGRIPVRMRQGVAKGTAEVIAKTDLILDHDVDWIKMIVTGAVLTDGTDVNTSEYSEDEVRSAVETAGRRGHFVTGHAHGAQGVKNTIRGGARSVEHASLIDDEGIALAKRLGTYLVMDIYNGDYIDTVGRQQQWSAESLQKNLDTTEAQRQGFRKAVEAGVNIAYGTDAGVYPHGDNARQFPYMVRYGMTPMQAIQSATINAARLLDKQKELGSVVPGKPADLVAMGCDPVEKIACTADVQWVMKAGESIKGKANND